MSVSLYTSQAFYQAANHRPVYHLFCDTWAKVCLVEQHAPLPEADKLEAKFTCQSTCPMTSPHDTFSCPLVNTRTALLRVKTKDQIGLSCLPGSAAATCYLILIAHCTADHQGFAMMQPDPLVVASVQLGRCLGGAEFHCTLLSFCDAISLLLR